MLEHLFLINNARKKNNKFVRIRTEKVLLSKEPALFFVKVDTIGTIEIYC